MTVIDDLMLFRKLSLNFKHQTGQSISLTLNLFKKVIIQTDYLKEVCQKRYGFEQIGMFINLSI